MFPVAPQNSDRGGRAETSGAGAPVRTGSDWAKRSAGRGAETRCGCGRCQRLPIRGALAGQGQSALPCPGRCASCRRPQARSGGRGRKTPASPEASCPAGGPQVFDRAVPARVYAAMKASGAKPACVQNRRYRAPLRHGAMGRSGIPQIRRRGPRRSGMRERRHSLPGPGRPARCHPFARAGFPAGLAA